MIKALKKIFNLMRFKKPKHVILPYPATFNDLIDLRTSGWWVGQDFTIILLYNDLFCINICPVEVRSEAEKQAFRALDYDVSTLFDSQNRLNALYRLAIKKGLVFENTKEFNSLKTVGPHPKTRAEEILANGLRHNDIMLRFERVSASFEDL